MIIYLQLKQKQLLLNNPWSIISFTLEIKVVYRKMKFLNSYKKLYFLRELFIKEQIIVKK